MRKSELFVAGGGSSWCLAHRNRDVDGAGRRVFAGGPGNRAVAVHRAWSGGDRRLRGLPLWSERGAAHRPVVTLVQVASAAGGASVDSEET
jgi:hypothetical protein